MAKKGAERSEADIARAVVAELQAQGYTTYEEVVCGSTRADVVAVRGPMHVIVEVKAAMSLRLLDQLVAWRGAAHVLIAAVGGGRIGPAVNRLLLHEGIGLWIVGFDEVSQRLQPRLNRQARSDIRERLCDEQRSGEYAKAGTQGSYWTPFARTARELARVVADNPGVSLRDALHTIDHHYASTKTAIGALPKLIRDGVIRGVRLDDSERPLRLYPAERANP